VGEVASVSKTSETQGEMDTATTRAARTLSDSLQRLLALPDNLEIYPAHFAGSACGRALSGKPSSTLGFERRFNPALRQRSPDEFVAFMLADLPAPPAGHRAIRAANRLGGLSAAAGAQG
jgi:hydroxyacylglutathione hydrolase